MNTCAISYATIAFLFRNYFTNCTDPLHPLSHYYSTLFCGDSWNTIPVKSTRLPDCTSTKVKMKNWILMQKPLNIQTSCIHIIECENLRERRLVLEVAFSGLHTCGSWLDRSSLFLSLHCWVGLSKLHPPPIPTYRESQNGLSGISLQKTQSQD